MLIVAMAKVVCFDFDDVLTNKSTLRKFMTVFGHTFKELRYGLEIFEDNKHPKKFFKTVDKVIQLGKGVKYERVEKIVYFLRPNKNARKTLKKLKASGYMIVIASINDENLIRKFLKKYQLEEYIDHIYAGKLGVKNGLLTGEITGDVIKTEKIGVIKKMERLYKAKKSDIHYIGDGLTDLPIIKKLGHGILFNPNPLTNAEILTDRELMKIKKSGRLFLVENKDLANILQFIN